jgi:hypothetical protein
MKAEVTRSGDCLFRHRPEPTPEPTEVEIDTLEDLIEFMKRAGNDLIISLPDSDGVLQIEIYDCYRE